MALGAATLAVGAGQRGRRRAAASSSPVLRKAEEEDFIDYDPEDWVKRVKMIEGQRALFDVTIPKPLGLVPANFPNRPGVDDWVPAMTAKWSARGDVSARQRLDNPGRKPILHKVDAYPWAGAWGGPERPPPPPPGPLKLQICRPLRAKRQLQRPILMETKATPFAQPTTHDPRPFVVESFDGTWRQHQQRRCQLRTTNATPRWFYLRNLCALYGCSRATYFEWRLKPLEYRERLRKPHAGGTHRRANHPGR
eukprot:symbB.v1.2.017215.t1/scaffold1333.1/size124786/1